MGYKEKDNNTYWVQTLMIFMASHLKVALFLTTIMSFHADNICKH